MTEANRTEDQTSAPPRESLTEAALDMWRILDELEGAFDKEIYPEQLKEDFDAPDDREYSVTITAKQWRALSRAVEKAEHRRGVKR
jgi:hypothetical protein